MSPYPYKVMEKRREVIKCNSCKYNYAEKYNRPPHNLIIKHVDQGIRSKSNTGQICYNVCLIPAYYCANKLHTVKKNPLFDRIVMISPLLAEKRGQERLTFSLFSDLNLCCVEYFVSRITFG